MDERVEADRVDAAIADWPRDGLPEFVAGAIDATNAALADERDDENETLTLLAASHCW